MTRNGVDYAYGRPGSAALKAAGFTFVCRYLATAPGQRKNPKDLDAAEARELVAGGVDIVSNWETTATFMLGGYTAGVRDAHSAEAEAASVGAPSSAPIYFSADSDMTPAQRNLAMAYLDGAASVIGRARVGVYGSYYVCKQALDTGKAAYAWQTFAWSGGQWDPRVNIRQGRYVTVNGTQCDQDVAFTADFGQWSAAAKPPVKPDVPPVVKPPAPPVKPPAPPVKPPVTPTPKDMDMATPQEAAAAFLAAKISLPSDADPKRTQSVETVLRQTDNAAFLALAKINDLIAKVDALAAKLP